MTQRDGSRTLRTPSIHIPREKKAARGQSFTFAIEDGVYRLRERFVGSKVDRRTTGPGMSTQDGLKAGVRFVVQPALWLERGDPGTGLRSIQALWTLGAGDLCIGRGDTWFTPIPDDMERLFGLLDRDESLATWLDVTTETGKYQQGSGDAILLQLLTEGTVTKEQILAAKIALKEPT